LKKIYDEIIAKITFLQAKVNALEEQLKTATTVIIVESIALLLTTTYIILHFFVHIP